MNKDSKLLSEAYEQICNEGIWDRTKAKTASAASATKNIGSTLKGAWQGAKALGHQMTGNKQKAENLWQQSQANIQTGKEKALVAKINSILNSKTDAINNLSKDIINDLNKLGLNTAQPGAAEPYTPQELAATMIEHLNWILSTRNPEASPGLYKSEEEPESASPETPAAQSDQEKYGPKASTNEPAQATSPTPARPVA